MTQYGVMFSHCDQMIPVRGILLSWAHYVDVSSFCSIDLPVLNDVPHWVKMIPLCGQVPSCVQWSQRRPYSHAPCGQMILVYGHVQPPYSNYPSAWSCPLRVLKWSQSLFISPPPPIQRSQCVVMFPLCVQVISGCRRFPQCVQMIPGCGLDSFSTYVKIFPECVYISSRVFKWPSA